MEAVMDLDTFHSHIGSAQYNNPLRYFFRRRIPHPTRILLIESGSRGLIDAALVTLKRMWGERLEIDLVTCYAVPPTGFGGRVFNVNDYGGPAERNRLLAALLAREYAITGVLCSAEPIMTKWKWWLGAKLPAKIFVINENADIFWLDWGHASEIRRFIADRAGLTGPGAAVSLARLVFFPVTLGYLLLYAGYVHLRRRLRLL